VESATALREIVMEPIPKSLQHLLEKRVAAFRRDRDRRVATANDSQEERRSGERRHRDRRDSNPTDKR